MVFHSYESNTPARPLYSTYFEFSAQNCPHSSFQCNNQRCIDPSIRCNGYDSCGDNSGCRKELSSIGVAGIVVGSLVGSAVLLAIGISIACNVLKNRGVKKVKHILD